MSLHVHHYTHTHYTNILYRLSLDLRDPNVYASAWMDSISMERLSASPYALDIYGNCATSQLTQVADNTLLAHIIHERRQQQLHGWQYVLHHHITLIEEQLSIAHHVASGIADLHHVGIAHNDLSHGSISICRWNLQNFRLSFSQFCQDEQREDSCRVEKNRKR